MAGKSYTLGLDIPALERDAAKAKRTINGIEDEVESTGKKVNSTFATIGKTLAGLGAAVAVQQVISELTKFSQVFNKSMLEVRTISKELPKDFEGFKKQVLELTTEIPIKADEAAKALYQIVSAGHDGADGMHVLEVAAKAAIGGVTDTATAADAITSLLNAYNLNASEAESVSDKLFTTVRLGKTDMTQLGSRIAAIAPLAASFGIEMEQVLAAVATLTASGTPTAEAMTQIRSSIIEMNKQLGDGYFRTHTYQEGLQQIAIMAGGSETKLRELIPSVEAMNAVLGMTGNNAERAASHLKEFDNIEGASMDAFNTMLEDSTAQTTILMNNIKNVTAGLGNSINEVFGGIALKLNEAFDNGDLKRYIELIGGLIVAFGSYKTAVIAINGVNTIKNALQKKIAAQMVVEAALNKAATAAELRQAATTKVLTIAKNNLAASIKAVTASLALNPYAVAAASVAALGVAIYKTVTYQTSLEKSMEKFAENSSKAKVESELLFNEISKLEKGTTAYNEVQKKIVETYPEILRNQVDESGNIRDLKIAYDLVTSSIEAKIASQIKEEEIQSVVTRAIEVQQQALDSLPRSLQAQAREMAKNGKTAIEIVNELNKSLTEGAKIEQEASAGEALRNRFTSIEYPDLTREFAAINQLVNSVQRADAEIESITNAFSVFIPDSTKKDVEDLNYVLSMLKQELKDASSDEERERIIEEISLQKELFTLKKSLDFTKGETEKKDIQSRITLLKEELDLLQQKTEKKVIDTEEEVKDEKQLSSKKIDEKQIKDEEELKAKALQNELASMQQYLKEYGTFQQRKLAIAEEYAMKISQATTTGEKLSLGKERDASISKIENEALMSNIDWELVFGEFGTMFNFMIEPALQKAREYMQSPEFASADLASKNALIEAVQKMESAVGQGGGLNFKELANETKNLQSALLQKNDAVQKEKKAYETLAEAQSKYEEALKSGSEAEIEIAEKSLENAKVSADAASENVKITSQAAIESSNAVKETANSLKNSMDSVVKGLSQITSGTLSGILDGISALGNANGQLGSAFSKVSDKIESVPIIGWIVAILDIFSEGATEVITGIIDGIFGAINGIIEDVLSFDLIKGLVESLIKGIAKLFENLFTMGGLLTDVFTADGRSIEEVESQQALMIESNDNLKSSIDKLSEVMQEQSVGGAKLEYEKQIALMTEQWETYKASLLNTGNYAARGERSSAYYIDNMLSNTNWQDITDLLGFDVFSANDLFSLSPEDLNLIKNELPNIYSLIMTAAESGSVGVSEILEQIAALEGEAQEKSKEYKEYLTNITFENLRDNFAMALSDMSLDASNFADGLDDMFTDAIINSITSNYLNELEEWYENFATSMEDGLMTEEERIRLQEQYNSIVNDALSERDAAFETLGIESSATRSATAQAVTNISQESFDDFSGRMTAVQADVYSISQQLKIVRQNSQRILEVITGISEHTALLVPMRSAIDEVNSYVRQININGVIIRN